MSNDSQDPLALNPREERLGELVNEFLDRRQTDAALTEDAFLREYPDFADDLRQHFASLDMIQGLGSSGAQTLLKDAAPSPEGSSAAGLEQPTGSLPDIPGYDVVKQIGRGGMGVVFKAVQKSTRRIVALKVLLDGPFASDVAQQRFQREVTLAAQLRHPGIIPIYDSGHAGGRMYYAMEHIYGVPLDDYVRVNRLAIADRARLFIKVCDALSYAHQRGVVHRDLKPSNVLVDGNGEPHVLDFGLAKADALTGIEQNLTAQLMGTPAYMSPEQVVGDPDGVDILTDIYSQGVILYELLTGEMPYDTSGAIGRTLHNIAHALPASPEKVNADVDSELAAIVLKALHKSKDERYQSVDALRADLRNYLEGDPVSAKPPSSFDLLRRVAQRHRGLLARVAIMLLVGIGSIMFVRRSMVSLDRQMTQQAEQVQQLQHTVDQKQAEVQELREGRVVLESQLASAQRAKEDMLDRISEALASSKDPEKRKAFADVLELIVSAMGQEERMTLLPKIITKFTELGAALAAPRATTAPTEGQTAAAADSSTWLQLEQVGSGLSGFFSRIMTTSQPAEQRVPSARTQNDTNEGKPILSPHSRLLPRRTGSAIPREAWLGR